MVWFKVSTREGVQHLEFKLGVYESQNSMKVRTNSEDKQYLVPSLKEACCFTKPSCRKEQGRLGEVSELAIQIMCEGGVKSFVRGRMHDN